MHFLAPEQRMFAAAAVALVDGPLPPGEPRALLDHLQTEAPWHVAWGLRALLWLGWLSPVLGLPRPLVARWNAALNHPVRLVAKLALALKAIVCLAAFDAGEPFARTAPSTPRAGDAHAG